MFARFRTLESKAAVFAIAAVAVFAVFARAPEEVRVVSADGRMAITGAAPRSIGPFSIRENDDLSAGARTAVVSPIYSITPSDVLLPQPLRIEYQYGDIPIEQNPLAITLARYHAAMARWEPVPTQVDFRRAVVYADVRIFSDWALLRIEDLKIPESVDVAADRLIAAAPADAVGFLLDVEYARVPEDFVLLRPAYRVGGCRGLLEGQEKQQIRETMKEGDVWFRITLTWETGGRERCDL
ncbi:MAG: hypothetical protein Q8P82_01880 [bacterium]|nr:hypothetical protein [bacterium]